MSGVLDSTDPSRWNVRVQTVVSDTGAGLLFGWAQCLDEAVRHARRHGHVGRVTAVIGDARPSDQFDRLRWDAPFRLAVDQWRVEDLPPGTGVAEGHNRLLGAEASDLVLLVDPTASLSPTCLSELIAAVREPGVGLVEPRHLPFQARKPYDDRAGDTSWASATCCLVRGQVMADVGGFDAGLFPADGADVDLSWRARLAGWRVRYVPWAAVFVHTHDPISEPLMQPRPDAKLSKLLLARRFGVEPVARMWAAAWQEGGTEVERSAVARFASMAAAGRLPERVAGDTDVFLPELFAFESELADPGPHRLDVGSMSAPAPRPVSRPSRPTSPGTAAPFLSVVVRTQGRRLAALEDNLLSLVSQTCQDFEVLLARHGLDGVTRQEVDALLQRFPEEFVWRLRRVDVTGGGRSRPLNWAVARAAGRYVAFLDDDDVALDNWVETFRQVAEEHPAAVAWTQVAWQTSVPSRCAGRETWPVIEAPQLFVREWDLFAHLRQNGTPSCALAIPITCFRDEGVAFREDLPVFEDWDVVLQLAQRRPFRSTGCVSALYRRGSPDGSGAVHAPADWDDAADQLLSDLDAGDFVLRGEYLPQLRQDLDELDERREQAMETTKADTVVGFEAIAASPLEITPSDVFAGRTVLVVCAHLDDGVLSCGELLAQLPRTVVLTVFAGDPEDWSDVTEWDRACGFEPGAEVMAARTAEDDRALVLLGATGLRLPFLDEQYREPSIIPAVAEVAREIARAIADVGAEVVLFPLGLGHPDHELAARGAARAALALPEQDWFAYQDLPYAYEEEDVEEALLALADLAPRPIRLLSGGDAARKAAAILAYSSQLLGLGERWSLALRPECYWKLTVPVVADPASPGPPGTGLRSG